MSMSKEFQDEMECSSKNIDFDKLKELKQNPDKHYRREELDRQIQAKFTLIHSEYKTGLTGIEKNDSELFARKNGEWKQYCHKIVQRQKLTTPNPFAFQNKVWNEINVQIKGKYVNGIVPMEYIYPAENFEIL